MSEECNHIIPIGTDHCALCGKRLYGGPDCPHDFYRIDHYTKRCPYCGVEKHLIKETWK